MVVVFHAWPEAMPGGFIGVDVFFVISGYLITGLLVREFDASGRIDFAAFYARRVRRLFPAAMLVIATTAVAAAMLRSPTTSGDLVSGAIASALYVSNLWFSVLSVDYLQDGLHRNPLLHTWSLGVEEQFYLVWPALMVGATMILSQVAASRAIAWMVAGVSVLSFVACVWLTLYFPSWAFFSLPARAWELGLGAAAFLLHSRAGALGGSARRMMLVAGLMCIMASAFGFSSQTRFPGYAALAPALGTWLVITSGTQVVGQRSFGLPRLAVMERLGDFSYSWYLWHWPLLILLGDYWPASGRHQTALAGVTASLALAALTFRFVEDPARHHKTLQTAPARTLALGLALMVITVAVAAASRFIAPVAQGDVRQKMAQASRDRPRLYDDKCFAAALDVDPPRCTYGVVDAEHSVALVGDSHAAQWFPAIEQLAKAKGFRLEVFVKAACPLAEVEPYDHKLIRPYVECTQWRERVFERLTALRPALVIGSNASQYEPFVTGDHAAQVGWQAGLESSLRRLAGVAGHVVVLGDTPRPGFHVPTCLARRQSKQGPTDATCSFQLSDSVMRDALRIERAAVQGRTNASVIDMNDAICTTPTCQAQKGEVVLYHDSQHLSATFAGSLSEELWRRLATGARATLKN